MVNWTEVIYVPQPVKNILSVPRLEYKGSTMGDTKEKITINKNSVNMILDTRKGIYDGTMFYLRVKRYAPEGPKPQESNSNLPEEKKFQDENDKK